MLPGGDNGDGSAFRLQGAHRRGEMAPPGEDPVGVDAPADAAPGGHGHRGSGLRVGAGVPGASHQPPGEEPLAVVGMAEMAASWAGEDVTPVAWVTSPAVDGGGTRTMRRDQQAAVG